MSWPIKFRAWDKQEKKFAKLATILFRPVYGGAYGLGDTQKDRLAIQLWTGLVDKNGREVYEGDVLKEIDHELKDGYRYLQGTHWMEDGSDPFLSVERTFFIESRAELFFQRHYIGWYRTNSGPDDGKPVTGLLNGGEFDQFEVIGNIYENPELLKPIGD